ncbi:Zn-dependent exopeptidase [Cadophora sp. DSE1049]|nr:Zn-dependent exopeptidase [Cadophora sp. DSE1049]
MLKTPEPALLQHWSRLYSAEPHLSGDYDHAERIRTLWQNYGIPTKLVQYDVLQNFPLSSSLAIYEEDGSIRYEAGLTEPALPEDPTSSPENGFPPFHGFSTNGEAHSELVYANFGTLADFQLLDSRGISVRNKIVICRYGKVFRGLKVRAAERYGAAAVIIYSDPKEDGEYTVMNGYKAYPHGPARHPQSVQRGSVDFFSVAVGDPTTPGYPSLPGKGTERKDPGKAIPKIPSLPISYADAIPFLNALNGQGLSPGDIGVIEGDWTGGIPGVKYWTGPSQLTVSMSNQGAYKYHPIYNVIGTIPGATDDLIILGNHHDSWSCGAVDPISGSASMNEVARGLGKLLNLGWKNERTIVLASWDDEEYGLVGSTEWVEENAEMLSKHCVAYLNVDESTNGGSIFGAVGSPLLAAAMRSVASDIPSPLSGKRTVYDDWLAYYKKSNPDEEMTHLELIGTGSDYTAFFDHLGIPCVDMVFNKEGKSVFHYHSNYDSYHWMQKFGDVGWKKHLAMARLWGVLAVRLANSDVISFAAREYASELERHTGYLKSLTAGDVDVGAMEESIKHFKKAATALDFRAQELARRTQPNRTIDPTLKKELQRINAKYKSIERAFLCKSGGLPGRKWFKHMIFAPGLWKGYDGVVFPGLVEALEDNDKAKADLWIATYVEAIQNLADSLQESC